MKNITLAIDEQLLRKVRRYAAEHDTTVNALVREHLTRLAEQQDKAKAAIAELLRLSDESDARLCKDWKLNREALYDRPMLAGHKRPDLRGGGQGNRGAKEAKGA